MKFVVLTALGLALPLFAGCTNVDKRGDNEKDGRAGYESHKEFHKVERDRDGSDTEFRRTDEKTEFHRH